MAQPAKNVKTTTAPPKKPGTALAPANSNALADKPPSELAAFMEEDAGKGVSTSSADVGIPFLTILQDLSPQVKKRDDKYIEGAEVGMILNTATGEVYSGEDGVLIIPAFFKSSLVEWIPRDKGGGWVSEYPIGHTIAHSATRTERTKPPRLPNGNDLIETRYYFNLHCKPDGSYEATVIGLASSGLKVSREWMRQIKLVKIPTSGAIGPAFSKAYRLKTKLSKNGAGQEFYTWSVSTERWVTSEEYHAAKQLEAECAVGNVQASRPDADTVGAGDGEEEQVL